MPAKRITAFFAAAIAAYATLAACADGHPRKPSRHLYVVNATFDSVTAMAVAPERSNSFQALALPVPLQGGLASITVALPQGGCLRDIRVTFLDGHAWFYPGMDVCRYDGLRLTPGGARPARLVAWRERH